MPASRRFFVLGAVVLLGGSVLGFAASAGARLGGGASRATGIAPFTAGAAGAAPTQGSAPGPTRGGPISGTGLPQPVGGARISAPPKLIGPVDAGESVNFGLTLKMAQAGAIEKYLEQLYDPKSPNYRHFLTAAAFGAKFGLPLDRIQGVRDWAAAQGLEVVGSYDQRTSIRLRATAGQITDVFGVHLGQFVDSGSGVQFHAPLNAETVPTAIRDAVVGLSGLDTRPVRSSAHELVGGIGASVPADGLSPTDIAKAYDIVPLYEAGLLGDGQTIAIVSFDTFTPGDITAYDKQFGIDGPAVKRVAVGTALTTPGDGTVEVALDIEVVRAVAPHAQILNFEAKNGKVDHADLVDAIVQDGRADIVTDSWGKCDVPDAFNTGTREHGLRSLQAATAAGISFFIASGDHGAFDCWSSDPSDHRETVDFPSASPYSLSVGGTQLSVRTDGTYLTEAGWEDYLSTGGSAAATTPRNSDRHGRWVPVSRTSSPTASARARMWPHRPPRIRPTRSSTRRPAPAAIGATSTGPVRRRPSGRRRCCSSASSPTARAWAGSGS